MQLQLPFGPIVNKELLSNHWLEHRLPLEPEWLELRTAGIHAAEKLIALWQKEKSRAPLYGDEAGLEEKFIQPVFEILGWHTKYQAYLQGREPDYALFVSDEQLNEALMKGRLNADFWLHAAVVADAKAWHVSLDRPQHIGSRREYPPEQIEWYLDRSRCDFGILTNGRIWRLVPRDIERSRPRFQTYLEVDLPALIERISRPEAQLQFEVLGPDLDLFLRFFLLFGVHGHAAIESRNPLIKRAVDGSSEHAQGVSEELKERVFEGLRLSIEGLIVHKANGLDPERDLFMCRTQGLVFLYRLLFILFAEDRGFLPYQKNDIYTRNRSLARFRGEVATKLDLVQRGLDREGYSLISTALWEELKSLFDIIDSGHRRYQVPPYNGGLFNPEEHPFLEEKAIPDRYLALILDQLSRAPHRDRPELGLFRVDYRDLAIQQLGSVYEGLLELQPRYAHEDMIVVRAKSAGEHSERILPAREAPPKGFERTMVGYKAGSVYLQTDKGERRAFGSYYTPDHIVNHMVEAALGQACRDIDAGIRDGLNEIDAQLVEAPSETRAELQATRKSLSGSFADRVLGLHILDPAMGSGHFLIRTCQYLAEEIATSPFTSDPEGEARPDDEASILYWKRRVVETCLFGVDLNPMAVELAKLALWLETVATDMPLAFLDHHLQAGDSLIGARIARLDSLPGTALTAGVFSTEIEEALPSLLDPLTEIRALRSSSLEEVKRKDQLFKKRFRTARARFEAIADVWCTTAIELLAGGTEAADYASVVQTLKDRRGVATNPLVGKAQALLKEAKIDCFHWELAFPEVFLTKQSARGFDVVIGNPPYDVLSEREAGPRVKLLQNFVSRDDSLTPSRVGKNNLYKLFIARACELTREGGIISFIVPMPLLGDEQARGIRQALLRDGTFTQIHAFPQKDNPNRRIFRDAKLSTALFVYFKSKSRALVETPFPSTRHPANVIDPQSPYFMVRTSEIPLYDPTNVTLVSCSQEDWDLAVRIAQRPGIKRLGTLCKSFQGEVNETTDRKFLSDSPDGERRLVLRGANVCMYVLREASQGVPLYLDANAFQSAKVGSEKAFHTRVERIGFQRSAPQNNYRRVIATRVPIGEFCFDTVSYIPRGSATLLDLDFLLALLNSRLIDWYFTIGSTNSKINEYQFNNLPCPAFQTPTANDEVLWKRISAVIDDDPRAVIGILGSGFGAGPFNPMIERSIIHLSRRIQAIETGRPSVSRAARSHLDSRAQPLQDAIDALLFALVGFGAADVTGLSSRLDAMS
jgi:Eco57I restriction-modification methylase